MKRKFGICLVWVMTFVMLASCSGKTPAKNLEITLEGNATTGYIWNYSIAPEGIIEEAASNYLENSANIAGAPGKFVFEFKGVSPGSAEITFVYARPWESVQPAEIRVYPVTVDKNLKITLGEMYTKDSL